MNQHYVPRVYLKNFGKQKGREFYVNTFDKIENRNFYTNIKNICSENDLYTLEHPYKYAKHNLVVEKIYSDFIEPLYAKTYKILTNDNIFEISDIERAEILISIFQFYFRNPIIFRKSIDLHTEKIKNLFETATLKKEKGLTYLDEDFSFREWNLEQIIEFYVEKLVRLFKEKHIIGTAQIGNIHEFTIIEVQKIECESNFLTNDNPLFLEDILSTDENPSLKSNEFSIPINKKYLVRIYHDNTKRVNLIYRRTIPNGSVNLINDDIFKQSSRFVIGEQVDLEELKKYKKMFDSTSLDLKIDFIKQILSNENLLKESDEGAKVLIFYYKKYLKNKTLTKLEEHEMIMKFKDLNQKLKIKKIK
ncbi:DUF4238 domain-containing protein [Flavobacterium chungbukense]|uniref:DUF4238 domain-containing protein n=1 Tax=Flavobacterium chungbukense TaxID=877464 RepID=A0ABP7YJN2_9FLAO|nr:DUF4238 domain-containing protein [Flavobacterium chungbukense]MCC4920156.1 DUF4238 domain-containing protein [Flavobacterium chungbukense]